MLSRSTFFIVLLEPHLTTKRSNVPVQTRPNLSHPQDTPQLVWKSHASVAQTVSVTQSSKGSSRMQCHCQRLTLWKFDTASWLIL